MGQKTRPSRPVLNGLYATSEHNPVKRVSRIANVAGSGAEIGHRALARDDETQGFHDSVRLLRPPGGHNVAAQGLAAWGIHQDLFAHGQARETAENAAVEAALAKPCVVLRRPLGIRGMFSEEPALPKVKGRAKKAKVKAKKKAVDRAKAARKKADATHRAEMAALKRERAALDAKLAEEKKAWRKKHKRLATR